MKRKIEQLLNETFEYEVPKMQLSEEKILVRVRKGETFRGNFKVENPLPRKMSGFIYSSNGRVGYEPEAFYSIGEKIVFEADTTGMEPGEVLDGEFIICSDIGEYRLPYRIEVDPGKTMETPVTGLEEFVRLAKEDFQKAYVSFLSPTFKAMLSEKDPQWLSLYEGLRSQSVNYSTLEEFLVGIKRKNVMLLSTEKGKAFFGGLTQPIQESLTVTKENWGFMRLEVSADAPFIKVEQEEVTTDEFLGRNYELRYFIDPAKLHAGKNYGYIMIKTCYQTLRFGITAVKTGARAGINEKKGSFLRQQKEIEKIYRIYLDFRLDRMKKEEWLVKSWERLSAYQKNGGNHTMLELFQAQLLFDGGREEEACMLLENLDQHKEKLNTPEILGYYLYLTTFYNDDREYAAYVEENIIRLQKQNPENWKLQWFLLYLQRTYTFHPNRKLEAIEEQFLYGCRSRIMYMEAWEVLKADPFLLKKLEAFERKLLQFICQEQQLTKGLVRQVTDLAVRQKKYSAELYEVLTVCYEAEPGDLLVNVICSLLIKGHKSGAEYLTWYEKGVAADLRITGLYEHYIESLGNTDIPLPKMVKMYFAYENTLSYYKKAQVYASIIRNKDTDTQTYENYRPMIEKFMVDQLGAGRISKDLALIYRTFLNRGVLNRKMAGQLAKAIFAHEIWCEAANISAVVVVHHQLIQEQKVSLTNGKAHMQLYTNDYQIFLEDQEGIRHAAGIPYTLTHFLKSDELFNYCRELAPSSPGLALYACAAADGIDTDNIGQFFLLLGMDEIKETFKKKLRQEILDYYYSHQSDPSLYDFLQQIDYDIFVKTDKKMLIELLTAEGMCQEAFSLTAKYGPEKVSPAALVRICSRNIISGEYESDDMLLYICFYCFSAGKYDETVLAYLLKFYDGPIESMKQLWTAGHQFELDTFILEEKIIMILIFSGKGAKGTEEIFDSYRRKLGKERLLQAYAVYCSYGYFVRDIKVENPVFEYIERSFAGGRMKQDICLLALLRWYVRQPALVEYRETNLLQLLEMYICRDMRFAFYQDLDPSLTRAFGIHDKNFIEYRTAPDAKVLLRYYKEDRRENRTAKRSEEMKQVYQGIFSAEVTLFYGEKIVYRIIEDRNGVIRESEEMVCAWEEQDSKGDNCKYALLNRLSRYPYEKTVKTYLEQECLVEELFTLK